MDKEPVAVLLQAEHVGERVDKGNCSGVATVEHVGKRVGQEDCRGEATV